MLDYDEWRFYHQILKLQEWPGEQQRDHFPGSCRRWHRYKVRVYIAMKLLYQYNRLLVLTYVCTTGMYCWTGWNWQYKRKEQTELFSVGKRKNMLIVAFLSRVNTSHKLSTLDLGRNVICVDPPPKSSIPTVLLVLEYKWPAGKYNSYKHNFFEGDLI